VYNLIDPSSTGTLQTGTRPMSSRHLVQEPPLAPSTAPTVDFAKRAGEVAGPVLHGSIDLSHRGGVPYFDAGILEGSRVGLHAAGSLSACLKSDGYPPPGWMIWQPRPRKKKRGSVSGTSAAGGVTTPK
jgi:hypothetical protein